MIFVYERPHDHWYPDRRGEITLAVFHEHQWVSGAYIAFDMHLCPLLCAVRTKSEFQRRGFAHELMRGVEQACWLYDLKECWLETGRTGHPRHLYESHGWQPHEMKLPTWYGETTFAMKWSQDGRTNPYTRSQPPVRMHLPVPENYLAQRVRASSDLPRSFELASGYGC